MLFSHPFYYLRSYSVSFAVGPKRNSNPGHHKRALPPPPHWIASLQSRDASRRVFTDEEDTTYLLLKARIAVFGRSHEGGGGGGGGVLVFLLALVIWPLTVQLFPRPGAPLTLLTQRHLPTFGRSLRFFTFLPYDVRWRPFCRLRCRLSCRLRCRLRCRRLSPRIILSRSIVFLNTTYSLKLSPCHIFRLFSSPPPPPPPPPPLTHPVPPCTTDHILSLCEIYA